MSWEGKQRNYNPWGSFPGVQTICFTIGSTWAFLQAFSRYCGGWGLGCCKKYHTGHRRLIPLPLNIPLYIQVHQPRACWHLTQVLRRPSSAGPRELAAAVSACSLSHPPVLFKAETYSAAIEGDQPQFLTTQLLNLFLAVPLRTLVTFPTKNPWDQPQKEVSSLETQVLQSARHRMCLQPTVLFSKQNQTSTKFCFSAFMKVHSVGWTSFLKLHGNLLFLIPSSWVSLALC